MLIVETGHSASPGDLTLRAMFEDRKRVFVDLLGWDVPVLDGRFELDQFDNEAATYIIIADEAGDHLGSARLLPTDRPHILGTLFRDLCASPPPVGPGIMEITRFCLSRRRRAAERLQTRNQLVSALAWYALDAGIRTYTGVAEIRWLQQILAFGWDCRPLGVPVRYDCGTLGALAIEISGETPSLLAANSIWQPPGDPATLVPQAA
ncbi:MAG TPA: acyl-homoserine-lactone synthase [Sphingomicrobium sp.]|jgi:acyl-homoserine lactone synthase|nr:acyl-homoserine-lactone synthase [Sphingomicrobium sp.]